MSHDLSLIRKFAYKCDHQQFGMIRTVTQCDPSLREGRELEGQAFEEKKSFWEGHKSLREGLFWASRAWQVCWRCGCLVWQILGSQDPVTLFWKPPLAPLRLGSDCHGLQVRYMRLQVPVHIPVPATYKTSPRMSKTNENWWRYGPNDRKHQLAHISFISWSFGLIFGGKTHRVAVKDLWGTGMSTAEEPQGYLWQSLALGWI